MTARIFLRLVNAVSVLRIPDYLSQQLSNGPNSKPPINESYGQQNEQIIAQPNSTANLLINRSKDIVHYSATLTKNTITNFI